MFASKILIITDTKTVYYQVHKMSGVMVLCLGLSKYNVQSVRIVRLLALFKATNKGS